MTIGERIKNNRERLGLSQVELAKSANISKQTLYKYEKNIITNIPLEKVETIANSLNTTPSYLMGWDREITELDKKVLELYPNFNPKNGYLPISDPHAESNVTIIKTKTYMIPVYESVSAGFGVCANNYIVDYIPLVLDCDAEMQDTICIKVTGDSMYPKIEDGDLIQVRKQTSIDSGRVGVFLIDNEDAVVKKVAYEPGESWLELHSFNPEYKTRRFEGPDVQRVQTLGLVKKVIKEV